MKRIFIVLASVVLLTALGVYIWRVVHETVDFSKPGQGYVVALGDSVAAGAGLSDQGGHKAVDCDVSDDAFPFLLGKQLHKPVEQLACSGATVASTAQSTNTLLDTQLVAAKPFLNGSDVVVYAGANDIGWLQALTNCVQTDCAASQTDTLNAKIQLLQKNLTSLLNQVQQAHPRRVVVNTYYNLMDDGDACFARFGVTPQKVSFIHNEEAELNAAITAAAKEAKATVVTVDFSGHSLCSAEPWIQGIAAKAPLHPNVAGQQQIAKQDAAALTGSPSL